jgi:hypothetical protein
MDTDDCPVTTGGSCAPHRFSGSNQWPCQPERFSDFWRPLPTCTCATATSTAALDCVDTDGDGPASRHDHTSRPGCGNIDADCILGFRADGDGRTQQPGARP